MSGHYDLQVTTRDAWVAELQLRDAGGNHLAYHLADFSLLSPSQKRGLFDLRNFIRHYAGEGQEAAHVAEIGVCIADAVLGTDIFAILELSEWERTLRIQLPGATDPNDHLAAALARVPWELARQTTTAKTLAERNLLVRIVHSADAPASLPLPLTVGESLRVLLVFAEARGARPLDARRERRALLDLFRREVYPRRRVEVDVISHGVTRKRLAQQIVDHGGYHIVHWSGHGHRDLLELVGPGGAKDYLSGEQLVDLFVQAGGYPPRLCFLGACHSGDALQVRNWDEFLAAARGVEPDTRAAATDNPDLAAQTGYAGTAHALLRRGVPSVVAMRQAVSDDYARDLALEFYRRMFVDTMPKPAITALTMARKALLDPHRPDAARYHASDHAIPVLYGEADPGLVPANDRSPALEARIRCPNPIVELTEAAHEHFVGRTWELAELGTAFIGVDPDPHPSPVATIGGLAGLGKTALAAEALSLWETRFDWIFQFQFKAPRPLDAVLLDIDRLLRAELGRYHDHVLKFRADAIHRGATDDFRCPARLERLTTNLIRALNDEAILLVFDNFETNLKPAPESTPGSPVWACMDPAWDRCVERLAADLVGSRSRVLITCRNPLAALANTGSHLLVLGPLAAGEAALYLRRHPGLSTMLYSRDPDEKKLAQRVLTASRFHPLLMDRLGRQATDPALRSHLLSTLQELEATAEYSRLVDLFTAAPRDAHERDYLTDALTTSLDRLLGDTHPDARCLLWTIAIANEPVALEILQGVWSSESIGQQRLRGLKQLFGELPQPSPGRRASLEALPPEVLVAIETLPPAPDRPALEPLLRQLTAVGLVHEEHTPGEDSRELTCHELVRERIRIWMAAHPQERSAWTEDSVRLAYAERLEAELWHLLHKDMTRALAAGSRALVYCVQAGAHDRLGNFASAVVTSSRDPRLLDVLLPHLEAAAASAPEGEPRWSCLLYLADALRNGGRPERGLPCYEQAATQARAVAEAGGTDAQHAWSDLAVVSGNWAQALLDVGHLGAARHRQQDEAVAYKNAGRPAIHILNSELEALRIDILQGRSSSALPAVELRLAQVEAWWQQHCAGQPVSEAPNAEVLARTLIAALDIATDAHFVAEDWKRALPRLDAILDVKRTLRRPADDIAVTRMNRANALGRLRRFEEARTELETCFELFQNHPSARAMVLSSLANLFYAQGDVTGASSQERRALALRETLPSPDDRATSHNNLATFLKQSAAPSDRDAAPRHQFAALLYRIVADLGQRLQTSLRSYAVVFPRAHAAGVPPPIPRVNELLADPAFHPLVECLHQREVDLEALQTTVDQLLDETRRSAQPTE